MEDVRVTWNDFEYNLKGLYGKIASIGILRE